MKYFGLLVIPLLVLASKKDDPECVRGPSTWYQGTTNVTRSGLPCQRWDVKIPHFPKFIPDDGGHHSYCRNPDNDIQGLWCYTIDQSVKWDYCEVPKCHDESLLVWSDFHLQFAHILATHADPELINPTTTSSGHFNLSILVRSGDSDSSGQASEFTAVTGSFKKQIVYYVDHRSNYVGKLDIVRSQRTEHLHGMAAEIKDIALDWDTGNVYWTNSHRMSVMVGDEELKYYDEIYKTSPDPPRGVAVHPLKRFLFFSIYKPLASKLVRIETSGRNPKVLLKFPQIFDVTSITVDYHDNRVYLGDFWNYGSMVTSIDLDGNDRVQHFYRPGSRFCGIASHLEYVYVADDLPEFDDKGELSYSLYLISKKFGKTLKYAVDGEPRGVAVLPEFIESEQSKRLGSCSSAPPCDHICLPQINETRVCLCSQGFVKIGDTKCVAELSRETNQNSCPLVPPCGENCPPRRIYNSVCLCSHGFSNNASTACTQGPNLYLADRGSQSIYGANMTSLSNLTLIVSAEREILSIATNPMRQGELVWSESDSIYKLEAGLKTPLATNVSATSLDVDTVSGNVYYYDDTLKTIYVTDSKQQVVVHNLGDVSYVTMLTVDVIDRFLYWSDTRSSLGEGQVWRSRMDGTEKTVVLDYLMHPQAVAVGQTRRSLFVVDSELQQLIELPMTSSNDDALTVEYDLSEEALRKNAEINYITDMKVFDDDVYFVRGGENAVSKFSLSDGSIRTIGEGRSVAMISIQHSFGQVDMNQCENCQGVCVPFSFYISSCLEL